MLVVADGFMRRARRLPRIVRLEPDAVGQHAEDVVVRNVGGRGLRGGWSRRVKPGG
jgi:hypothetical protein